MDGEWLISDSDQKNLAFLRSELGEMLLCEIPVIPRDTQRELAEEVEFPISTLVARLRTATQNQSG